MLFLQNSIVLNNISKQILIKNQQNDFLPTIVLKFKNDLKILTKWVTEVFIWHVWRVLSDLTQYETQFIAFNKKMTLS